MKNNLIILTMIILAAGFVVADADNTVVIDGVEYDYSNKGDAYSEDASIYNFEITDAEAEEPDPGTILQGGDGIADAFVITSLPFSDTGTTVGYTSDWDPTCCDGCMYGPDVVYSFTPTYTVEVDVNTCGSDFYDVLYIFQNSPDTILACNSWYDVCPPHSGFDRLKLTADNTYYFVVDGYWTSSGYYEIHIFEHEPIECPPEAIDEDEPECGDGYVDEYNSGCNNSTNPSYLDINIGDIYCGESGTFVTNELNCRDTDWYRLELTEPKLLHWYVTAEFPVQGFIFDADDENCDNIGDVIQGQTTTADTVHIAHNAIPGVYYFYVSPISYSGYPCPLGYLAWLEAEDPPDAPVNDDCSDVTPVHMTTSDTLVFTGTTIGATTDCRELNHYNEVWEAFEFDVMSDVKIEYCGTDPLSERSYVVLVEECPCSSKVSVSSYNRNDCGDDNITLKWYDLPAGSYYYPVLSQWDAAYGDYIISISSTSTYPGIDITPLVVNGEAEPGATTTISLELSNIGYDSLTFEIVASQDDSSTIWLAIDLANGSLPVGDSLVTIAVTMDATSLTEDTYTGTIVINSNSLDTPSLVIPVTFEVGVADYNYLPGDANMAAETWPAQTIGGDVTYLVNYFRGLADPCNLDGFYASADATGDCQVVGGDVTYLVNYFRGLNDMNYCVDYEPAWPTPSDVPADAPDGWPNCD